MTRLWAAAPPVVRWRALRELADKRAGLQAMTVHQLLPEDGSRRGLGELARTLGVTTSWVSQLAALPRRHAGLFAWGRALAVASDLVALAERSGSSRLSGELAGMIRRGLHDTSPLSDLEDAASRWAVAARRQRRGPEADALVERLNTLLARVTPALDLDWLARAEIALGYQTGRPSAAGGIAPAAGASASRDVAAGGARVTSADPAVPTPRTAAATDSAPPPAVPGPRRGPSDPLPWSRYRLRDR
ncbi:hypothetical protein BL253_12905 [Pseudofrankia asymbiotica]|uniref:Uncharacterized protein n=2 Tax=Pseudofrankia asymbiotica TaxID=1834516 RepID=A0A1V2ICT0_9ACTN|nr:hypothetical protein BL253_12905 [Pseudofrankia asymbiotica]